VEKEIILKDGTESNMIIGAEGKFLAKTIRAVYLTGKTQTAMAVLSSDEDCNDEGVALTEVIAQVNSAIKEITSYDADSIKNSIISVLGKVGLGDLKFKLNDLQYVTTYPKNNKTVSDDADDNGGNDGGNNGGNDGDSSSTLYAFSIESDRFNLDDDSDNNKNKLFSVDKITLALWNIPGDDVKEKMKIKDLLDLVNTVSVN
jgi:hypothetical protein